MSKQSKIRLEKKIIREVANKAAKRRELRKVKNDPNVSIEDKMQNIAAFAKLGRKSSACRLSRRCWKTGRSRGVYRKLGLCRNMIRIHVTQGDVPGVKVASW